MYAFAAACLISCKAGRKVGMGRVSAEKNRRAAITPLKLSSCPLCPPVRQGTFGGSVTPEPPTAPARLFGRASAAGLRPAKEIGGQRPPPEVTECLRNGQGKA